MSRTLLILLFALTAHTLAAQDAGSYFTSFDGIRIYYEVKGLGKPVVLVHGFIVDSESWKKTMLYDDLLKNGYKVITLDLRGNGKSDKPHDAKAYLNDAEAKDIKALIRSLGIEHYDVVGYSRGAIIASRLLVLDRRARRGVLGGMGSDFTNPEWPRRKMFFAALMGESVPELAGMVKFVKDSGLDTLALAYMQNGQPTTTAKQFAALKKPVLVICGADDEDNGSSRALADMIPRSEYARVPGNHNNAARSADFSAVVSAFLASRQAFKR